MPEPTEIVTDTVARDTKDWTWVLDRPCPECGLVSAGLDLSDLPGLLRTTAFAYGEALRDRETARRRPDPARWSPLEYVCHVRDLHRVFDQRLDRMLTEDAPTFPDWDQDAAALEGRYAEQDPETVEVELIEAAGAVAGRYASVTPEQAGRVGLRSNGSRFTVLTLGRYHLHDVVHHLHDLGLRA